MAMSKANVPEVIPTKNIFVGPATAPVTLVMYGDYESDACARANEALKKILEQYGEKVRFNFRHFPQTQVNQKAMKAAEASMAAAQEGKFWEMHNILFERKRHLGTVSLKEYAREVGVKNKKFLDELVNSKYSWYVRGDQIEAWEKGFRTVPAVIINGEKLSGAATYENMKTQIEQALKKPAKNRA